MERYRKQQSELYFTDEGKQHLVEAITAPAGQRPQRRRPHAVAAVAAALALTVSAGALSPGVRGMLSEALGGFEPYAQEVQMDAVVDQGIEIKVLSAMADSTATVVYAQARDLTGDRLRGEMRITGVIQSQAAVPGASITSYAECAGYDEETGAALLKFTSMKSQPEAETGAVERQLVIFDFQPQIHSVRDLPLPNELLTEEALRSFRPSEEDIIPGGSTVQNPAPLVLEPGQTPAGLGSELVSLSSLGFASDGRLHILLEVPADAAPSGSVLLSTLRSQYLESLDDAGVTPQMANEYFKRYNDLLPGVWFTWDGGLYYDMSFPAGPDALDDLLLETIYGTVSLSEPVQGMWSIPLTMETLPEVRLPLSSPLDGISNLELTLSPLSVSICVEDSSQPGCGAMSRTSVTACLRDGTRIKGETKGGAFNADGTFCTSGTFTEPIDLEQLAGISIGDWMVPIENGAAGVPYLID